MNASVGKAELTRPDAALGSPGRGDAFLYKAPADTTGLQIRFVTDYPSRCEVLAIPREDTRARPNHRSYDGAPRASPYGHHEYTGALPCPAA